MVGDGENDVKAGLAAGCKSILINGESTDHKDCDPAIYLRKNSAEF